MSHHRVSVEKQHSGWQKLLDKLSEWESCPSSIAEDDLTPPSAQALAAAREIAEEFCDGSRQVPDRVVPDGDGGIAFETYFGDDSSESIDVDSEGGVEVLQFRGSRILSRNRIR